MTLTFNASRYSELLSQYQPKLIRTEEDNERALAVVEELMHRPNRSPEENELYDLLIALIEKFEHEFYQVSSQSNPSSMLEFLMEQQGIAIAELANVLGSEIAATEMLEGKRELSIAQVKVLSQLFKVDSSVFI
ncbi:MAG: hypothetical protein SFY66_15860 [Oculatellaceae cyanobacterium bins.114]|nr:hypothetical protein [Oculatellaceae cyanobacterium bins.114]